MTIYLDPGTGSMMIQFAIGAVTGVLVAARFFGRNIIALFRGKQKTAAPIAQNPLQENELVSSQIATTADKTTK